MRSCPWPACPAIHTLCFASKQITACSKRNRSLPAHAMHALQKSFYKLRIWTEFIVVSLELNLFAAPRQCLRRHRHCLRTDRSLCLVAIYYSVQSFSVFENHNVHFDTFRMLLSNAPPPIHR